MNRLDVDGALRTYFMRVEWVRVLISDTYQRRSNEIARLLAAAQNEPSGALSFQFTPIRERLDGDGGDTWHRVATRCLLSMILA